MAPAALALAAGLWDLAAPPVWRDEAATVSAAGRTLPEMLHLLRGVDAVHGLYYLLMHVVIGLFGTGEAALRLPSVIAGALGAAGVCALGRSLGAPRAGLYGGVLLAVMPVFSRYAQDARPYALTMAATVGVTLLLLRAVRRGSDAAFALYAVALAGLAYLNLFAFLVTAAHGVFVALSRGPLLRWCAFALPALAAVAPLAWVASRQSAQVGWIARPDASDTGMLAVQLFGDLFLGHGALTPAWLGLAPLAWLLALLGIRARAVRTRPDVRRRGGHRGAGALVRLAVPWLTIPPLALLAVSWAGHPVYEFRYVFCCVPAAALLAGAGLAALPRGVAVAALAAGICLSIPGQLATRGPDGRQDDPGPIMAVLASAARPGDAVMFQPPKVRKYAVVYPDVFARLDDVALARSPRADGSFAGRQVGVRVLPARLSGIRTLWVVGHTGKARTPNRRLDLVRRDFRPTGRWTSRGMFVTRYDRAPGR